MLQYGGITLSTRRFTTPDLLEAPAPRRKVNFVSGVTAFSPDYSSARERFRQAASRLGWQLEAYPLSDIGPRGEELTIDVGWSQNGDPEKTLVLSSGVHGVEGFFGSAVQVALLERWASESPPPTKCVFLHGLNPFGFAWLRRFDENNVDPNRNFLLADERYEGSPAGYAGLDAFLNPRQPPSRWEPFTLKALWMISRYGMPALQQAVAAGQYEFSRGLFFGGAGPSRMNQLLGEHMERWLRGSARVVHLDFHTGLGPTGTCKLLIDYPLTVEQRTRLTNWFGTGAFEACDSSGVAYDARGGFGRWCVSQKYAADYLFACAEFGTFGPIQVLAGLRAENQAHHWGNPSAVSSVRAKQRLRELFCPPDEAWRSRVLEQSLDLVRRAHQGLTDPSALFI
jgi:hypothetical protein